MSSQINYILSLKVSLFWSFFARTQKPTFLTLLEKPGFYPPLKR